MTSLIPNRYKVVQRRAAGEGVSGLVIKAKDTWGQFDLVAIKRPNPLLSPVDSRKKSEQIKREAETLKRLNHPAACTYVEDGKLPDSVAQYLVMNWVEGHEIEEQLRQLGRTGKTLDLGEALDILYQLADLLVHAHSRGVIHNDIDAKHLFWDTINDKDKTKRQLTLIDWANCALDTDTKPIATQADDLQQYGELMHRLLTGSTLDGAIRLGGEAGWQVEMREKNIPYVLHRIIGRAVGRDESPYQSMEELATELSSFKQGQDAPYQEKIGQVDSLLRAEQNRSAALAEAEKLIIEVEKYYRAWALPYRRRLEQIKIKQLEDATLVRVDLVMTGKEENWAEVSRLLIPVFGSDANKMSIEVKYRFYLASLMNETKKGSFQYDLRKKAMHTLLSDKGQSKLEEAYDHLLLSYQTDQPAHDPLLETLAQQIRCPYPPLRSQLSLSRSSALQLLEKEISEQLSIYRKWRQQKLSDSARQLADELLEVLATANKTIVEAGDDYDQASKDFHWAFYIDPYNYRLYYLSQLVGELAKAAQRNAEEWQKICDSLTQQSDYQFPAAQYYLRKVKEKTREFVAEIITEYIWALPRVNTAWEKLQQKAEQIHLYSSPLVQCTQSICASYRHLYGFAENSSPDLQKRLDLAIQMYQDAARKNLSGAPAALEQELQISSNVLGVYRDLYSRGLSALELIKKATLKLPDAESHSYVRQMTQDLDTLSIWKERYQHVHQYCIEHQYQTALNLLLEHPETKQDQDALQWLDQDRRPNWNDWQQFCDRAQRGLTGWLDRHYQDSYDDFSMANRQLPIGSDGQISEDLRKELTIIVNSLNGLQTTLEDVLSLLTPTEIFNTDQRLLSLLHQTKEYENTLIQILGGKPHFAESLEVARVFLKHARNGELIELQNSIECLAKDDPLLPGLQHIFEAIKVRKFEQYFADIIIKVQQGEIRLAKNQLISLQDKYSSSVPELFESLEHLIDSYAHLYGDVEATKSASAAVRIEYAEKILNETKNSFQNNDQQELRVEIATLESLLQVYKAINKQGLAYLETARHQIKHIRTQSGTLEKHESVEKLDTTLNGLARWTERRERIFTAWLEYQYGEALSQLQQTTSFEKESIEWLNETHRPDLKDWEDFCTKAQDLKGDWSKDNYEQSINGLEDLKRRIPSSGLSSEIPNKLNEQFERMVTDLKDLQGDLDKSLNLGLTQSTTIPISQTYDRSEEIVIQRATEKLRQGDVEKAWQLLAHYGPKTSVIICFQQICQSYRYLYGYEPSSQHIEERLSQAKQQQLQSKQVEILESNTKNLIDGESSILQWLISTYEHLYNQGEPRALHQNKELQSFLQKYQTHFFVNKLKNELDDLVRLLDRWQQIIEYWLSDQYHLANQQIEQISQQEKEATIWLNDEFRTGLQKRQEFNEIVQEALKFKSERNYKGAKDHIQMAREDLENLRLDPLVQQQIQTKLEKISQDLDQSYKSTKRKMIPMWVKLVGSAAGIIFVGIGGISLIAILGAGVPLHQVPDRLAALLQTSRPTSTSTPTPTDTPIPASTPTPISTDTPIPASTPTPIPTDTPIPVSTSSPVLTQIPEPSSTPTPIASVAPTPDLSSWKRLSGPNLLSSSPPEENYDPLNPSMYLNNSKQWNITTGKEPFVFFSQLHPFDPSLDFAVTMHIVKPDSQYGLAFEEITTGEQILFYLSLNDTGKWVYTVESIQKGRILSRQSSTFKPESRSFNKLWLRITPDLMSFVINDDEVAYTHPRPSDRQLGWNVGIYTGPEAHAVLGSVYQHEIVPAQ